MSVNATSTKEVVDDVWSEEDDESEHADGDDDTRALVAEASAAENLRDPTEAEKWLKRAHPYVVADTTMAAMPRQLLGAVAATSATSAGPSRSAGSADDAAAASVATAKATQHLNQILREGMVDDEHEVETYLTKIDKLPQSRLPPDSYQPYAPSPWHSLLIHAAADASKKIYDPQDGLLYVPGGDDKPCAIWYQKSNDRRILIVSVRGTASREDVLLDLNSESQASNELLDGTVLWHKGFLRVAEKIKSKIAARIQELRSRFSDTTDVLFTGHSLGGAIAQILLAFSFKDKCDLHDAVQGLQVHCITFGAPPVATVRIQPPAGLGVFLTIINEGDPVPLAQEEYTKTLISLYALSRQDFERKYGAVTIPDPLFRVSGSCVVLKDEKLADHASSKLMAVQVDANVVEKVIFANPWMHMMDEYLEQLKCLRDDQS